jgi:hypothetical protein
MNDNNPDEATTDSDDASPTAAADFAERDAQVVANPGRMPSAEEEAAADEAATHVDLKEVGAHEREMIEKGANVQGEGQIP